MATTTINRQYQDTKVDVKLILSALWITNLFVFAYVDIFAFFREDVLNAALDGRVANMPLEVNQVFLAVCLVYILVPALMVILSLVLRPRVNRIVNIVAGVLYATSVLVSCLGETWGYYIIGSVVEAVLLIAIARTAWNWPAAPTSSALT